MSSSHNNRMGWNHSSEGSTSKVVVPMKQTFFATKDKKALITPRVGNQNSSKLVKTKQSSLPKSFASFVNSPFTSNSRVNSNKGKGKENVDNFTPRQQQQVVEERGDEDDFPPILASNYHNNKDSKKRKNRIETSENPPPPTASISRSIGKKSLGKEIINPERKKRRTTINFNTSSEESDLSSSDEAEEERRKKNRVEYGMKGQLDLAPFRDFDGFGSISKEIGANHIGREEESGMEEEDEGEDEEDEEADQLDRLASIPMDIIVHPIKEEVVLFKIPSTPSNESPTQYELSEEPSTQYEDSSQENETLEQLLLHPVRKFDSIVLAPDSDEETDLVVNGKGVSIGADDSGYAEFEDLEMEQEEEEETRTTPQDDSFLSESFFKKNYPIAKHFAGDDEDLPVVKYDFNSQSQIEILPARPPPSFFLPPAPSPLPTPLLSTRSLPSFQCSAPSLSYASNVPSNVMMPPPPLPALVLGRNVGQSTEMKEEEEEIASSPLSSLPSDDGEESQIVAGVGFTVGQEEEEEDSQEEPLDDDHIDEDSAEEYEEVEESIPISAFYKTYCHKPLVLAEDTQETLNPQIQVPVPYYCVDLPETYIAHRSPPAQTFEIDRIDEEQVEASDGEEEENEEYETFQSVPSSCYIRPIDISEIEREQEEFFVPETQTQFVDHHLYKSKSISPLRDLTNNVYNNNNKILSLSPSVSSSTHKFNELQIPPSTLQINTLHSLPSPPSKSTASTSIQRNLDSAWSGVRPEPLVPVEARQSRLGEFFTRSQQKEKEKEENVEEKELERFVREKETKRKGKGKAKEEEVVLESEDEDELEDVELVESSQPIEDELDHSLFLLSQAVASSSPSSSLRKKAYIDQVRRNLNKTLVGGENEGNEGEGEGEGSGESGRFEDAETQFAQG